ncbi:MAG: tetratricopeptide (TPR) repeat protein, partial [Gammaproteobacteria bacterium]
HYRQLAALTEGDGFDFGPESAFRLGRCELEQGQLAPAIAAFESALGSDRDYLEAPASYFMGEAYFRGEQFAAAEPYYDRARHLDAESYGRDAEYGLVWCAFRREAHGDVVQRVEAFVSNVEAERRGEFWFMAGEAHLELGHAEQALTAYGRVETGDYQDDALRGAGFAAAELGNHADAARSFRLLLDSFPRSSHAAEAALHWGVQLFQGGELEAAERALAHPLLEGKPEAALWRAQAQRGLGQEEAALETLDRVGTDTGGPQISERLRSLRGEILLALGRSDEAARAFEQAGSEYALHAAAIAELQAGRFEQAERLARGLLADETNIQYRAPAQLTLAEALFEQERYRDARSEFETALSLGSAEAEQTRCRSRIAWCQFFADEYGPARAGFEQLAAQHPQAEEAEEALFMAARCAELDGDAAGAAQAGRRYLERHAQGTRRHDVYLSLSRLDPERSMQWLQRLLDEDPAEEFSVQAHFGLAEQLSASGEFAMAMPHYRLVIEMNADADTLQRAAYGLAWSQYNVGEYAAAAEQLAVLVDDREVDPQVRTAALELLVWSAGAAQQPDQAYTAYRKFLALCEDETRRFDAANVVCEALGAEQRHDDSQRIWSALLESTREPRVAVAICVEQSYLALEKAEPDLAAAHARAAHEFAPTDPALAEALFFVGEAYFDAGAFAQAIEIYKLAAIPNSPTVCQALYKQGFAQLQLDNSADAAVTFARLVDEQSDCALAGESRFLLGEAYFRQGQWDAAVASLESMRKSAGRHAAMPKALFRLGLAYGELEDWDASQRILSELARKHADFEHSIEAELWRGRALCNLGQERGARAALGRVLAGDQGVFSARARLELGQLALKRGDPDAALSEFLKVAVLYAYEAEVSEALFRAGGVLEQQGQGENARRQYDELISRFPDNRFAELARVRVGQLTQR